MRRICCSCCVGVRMATANSSVSVSDGIAVQINWRSPPSLRCPIAADDTPLIAHPTSVRDITPGHLGELSLLTQLDPTRLTLLVAHSRGATLRAIWRNPYLRCCAAIAVSAMNGSCTTPRCGLPYLRKLRLIKNVAHNRAVRRRVRLCPRGLRASGQGRRGSPSRMEPQAAGDRAAPAHIKALRAFSRRRRRRRATTSFAEIGGANEAYEYWELVTILSRL